jgi:4-hydroxybenzoate polyprenyltransferase
MMRAMETSGANRATLGARLWDRAVQYWLLTRQHRPIGWLLLYWPCFWALWIAADGVPDLDVFAVFTLGTILMRSAGCAINDYADRDFDPHVARTAVRPVAAGTVSPREALAVAALLALISFGLVLTMNALTVRLSFVGVLLAVSYPFAKRYTHWPQLHLGLAFGWAVPMGYAAQAGALPPTAWLLYLAAILWAMVYDTLYAMHDRPEDLRIGVKSTAILFGRGDRLAVGLFQLALLATLLAVGLIEGLGGYYWGGLVVATGLGLYHQWLVRERDPAACFHAFLHNNWLGIAVAAGVAADYLGR